MHTQKEGHGGTTRGAVEEGAATVTGGARPVTAYNAIRESEMAW